MISEETIRGAVDLLKEAANPVKIILFGSYASGHPSAESDLDFLVIESEIQDRRAEMVRLRRAVRQLRIPVDVMVVCEQDVQDWGHLPGTSLYPALKEGRVLYESP